MSDVHTGRHAQRVQYNVNRGAVFGIRHILKRQYAGNRTFVTVAAGHFITGLHLTLGGNKDFDRLQNAGQEIVAALNFFHLVVEVLLHAGNTGIKGRREFFDPCHDFFVFDHDLTPLRRRNVGKRFFRQNRLLGNALRRIDNRLADQHFL